MTDPLMDIQAAAEWLGIHPKTLGELVSARKVPFTMLPSTKATAQLSPRLVRFAEHHLDAIVAMGEQSPIGDPVPAGISRIGATHPPAGPSTPPPPSGPREGRTATGRAA